MKITRTFLFVGLLLGFCVANGQVTTSRSGEIAVKIGVGRPRITIIQPALKDTGVYFHDAKSLMVKGKAVAPKGIYLVMVNGVKAEVDENGLFQQSVKIPLGVAGEYPVKIELIDQEKQVTQKIIRVVGPDGGKQLGANKLEVKNYALIIGTNKYDQWTPLVNPVFDGRTIAAELRENYDFKVDTLFNPTQEQMLLAIRKYNTFTYSDFDQLFIFIAGHGDFDEQIREGYIVPKDGKKNDRTNSSYISHSNLRTLLNNIPCKHVFLTLDACFGGTFDQLIASRGKEDAEVQRDLFIQRKLKNKTRLYLTSGGKEYVPDGRPGYHSPFAFQFITALRTYGGADKLLTFNELLTYVETVNPEPQKGNFGDNQPGSDFLFIAK